LTVYRICDATSSLRLVLQNQGWSSLLSEVEEASGETDSRPSDAARLSTASVTSSAMGPNMPCTAPL
jgi:hypothetical protein